MIFKMGDIIKFKRGDGWDKFLKGNYEIGFARSQSQIKLQSIRTKERLPQTFNSSSFVLVRKYKR